MISENIAFLLNRALKFLFVLSLSCAFSANVYASDSPVSSEDHKSEQPGHEQSEHGAAGAPAENHHEKEPLKVDEVIMEHISDAYEWHLMTIGHTHVSFSLPVILYSNTKGLQVFMASRFKDEHHNPTEYNGYRINDHGKIEAVDANETIYDFSITKNVFQMMVIVVLMCYIFISIARAYAKRGLAAPKGMQNLFEPIIIFIRDEVAKPNLGHKTNKYLPYLLTLFFFIWFLNLAGLLPGSANVTGNIAVTMVLALFTLFITVFSGNKHYWGHIFWMPGAPWWLKITIMPLVEVLGIFTKPFALMIRLFANITAGHIIILSIICLIFMFGEKSATSGFGVSVISTAFGVFLYFLELLVSVIQAYIFTLLTALFIGQAVEEHEAHH